jgi:hypothetical protein
MNTKNQKKDDNQTLKEKGVSVDKTDEIAVVGETTSDKEIVEGAASQFQTLIFGLAPKLSVKSSGKIGYELALNADDKCQYIRLTSNDSGGLFSKEWIKLDDLYELLEAMKTDTPFKSSIFKGIVKGQSSNNVSFVSAVLRCDEISLILQSDKNQYLHLVNPLLAQRKSTLTKLKPLAT